MCAPETKGFADYRLVVDGLVERPLSLSLAELRAQPSRTQITRHDCVEGWSSIAKWTGARLGPLLDQAGLKPNARYIVFHCADTLERDAGRLGPLLREHRPDRRLPPADHPGLRHERPAVAGGARRAAAPAGRTPARLQAGQVRHAASRPSPTSPRSAGGKGGFWEDRGYEWYAGI